MSRLINLPRIIFLFLCYLFFVNIALAAPSIAASGADISKLELVGTITGKRSFAVLRIANKAEGIYQLNQSILGYSIKAINKKSITLAKYKQIIKLSLVPVRKRQFFGLDANPKMTAPLKAHEYRINRNTFNSIKIDTQFWLDSVHFKLEIEDGYLSGYKITNIQKNSPAELLGLVEGDIIKGINGVLIKKNADNFIKKISLLEKANHFTLNMSHENTKFDLTFIIEDDEN
ncbi:hypothetical protein MNBD_GAMMA22-1238 [hydrothermal vent metagenome]|uniref:PDZ domain-containing protein n=1 Tax=hydrothermal vent metagenome TaxID=652676 RepID=A0A3B1AAJ3_9ZZZZ